MPQDLSDTTVFSGDEDLDPNYNWDRAIPAPGHSGVDFEKRVDFDRLHKYRLARAQEALAASDLGAVLCFDNNNIRYLTSTVIGEWSRPAPMWEVAWTGNGVQYRTIGEVGEIGPWRD